jgi:hypothetical protein
MDRSSTATYTGNLPSASRVELLRAELQNGGARSRQYARYPPFSRLSETLAVASVLGLLIIILLSVVVNRIGTVALTLPGLSREMARFQARSAFSTTGFTSNETEAVVNHPVRRRIVYTLMWVGNVGFIGVIATTVSSVTISEDDPYTLGARLAMMATGLSLLLAFAMSRWVDDQLFKMIGWALRRWTADEIQDYRSLLNLSQGYSVTELPIEAGNWPIGKRLDELRLSHIGVNVLGIRRIDGSFVGSPVGATYIRTGDRLIVYGSRQDVLRFNTSRPEQDWETAFQRLVEDRAPEVAAAEEKRVLEERRRSQRRQARQAH